MELFGGRQVSIHTSRRPDKPFRKINIHGTLKTRSGTENGQPFQKSSAQLRNFMFFFFFGSQNVLFTFTFCSYFARIL